MVEGPQRGLTYPCLFLSGWFKKEKKNKKFDFKKFCESRRQRPRIRYRSGCWLFRVRAFYKIIDQKAYKGAYNWQEKFLKILFSCKEKIKFGPLCAKNNSPIEPSLRRPISIQTAQISNLPIAASTFFENLEKTFLRWRQSAENPSADF
jgi:hypothetical protein